MTPNEFKERLCSYTDQIDRALDKYLPNGSSLQSSIYEAMRYSVFAGGKRLRPMLALECAIMCGGSAEDAMPFACAVEMIHTYSLIHDDLPAMDNDDMRRGMPTNHIRFGEAAAILAGDALLNCAFETMAQYGSKNALRAMRVIAKSAGTEGMIGGQVVDMESEDKEITAETLEYLQALKTGAIIRSACVAGAITADAAEEETAAVDEFAKNLGLAFQIRDDILDVTGNEEELGKPIGSDAEQNKNTYVSLMGLERSERLVKEYSQKAKDALNIFGKKADFLLALADYLTERRK